MNNEMRGVKTGLEPLTPMTEGKVRLNSEAFDGLVKNYTNTVGNYLRAMEHGMKEAGMVLSKDSSEESQIRHTVGQWFEGYSVWLGRLHRSLHDRNPRIVVNSCSAKGQLKPALVIASSILAGLVVGRLGNSAMKSLSDGSSSPKIS